MPGMPMPSPMPDIDTIAEAIARVSNLSVEDIKGAIRAQYHGGGLPMAGARGVLARDPNFGANLTPPAAAAAPAAPAGSSMPLNGMGLGLSGPAPVVTPQQTQDQSGQNEFMNWGALAFAQPFLSWISQMSGYNPFTGQATTAEQQRQFGNALGIGRFAPTVDRGTGHVMAQPNPQPTLNGLPGSPGAPGGPARLGTTMNAPTQGPLGSLMGKAGGPGNGTAANSFLRSTVGSETGEGAWSNLEDFLKTQYPDYWPTLQRGEDVGGAMTPEMQMYLRGKTERNARSRGAV